MTDDAGAFAARLTADLVAIDSVNPTLVCGPSGVGMHSVDEWVDLRQVRRFTEALVSVLEAPPTWGRRAD